MLPADVDHLIAREENRQLDLWGLQDHPDGTGWEIYRQKALSATIACNTAFESGEPYWALILLEEVYEALAESDTDKLKTELVQVAAVAKQWIKAIDRREKANGSTA